MRNPVPARRRGVVAVLASIAFALSGPAHAQDTIQVWLGTGWIEAPVVQLAALPSSSPALAQTYLNSSGYGAFNYWGTGWCEYESLFVHPAASSAPILAAVTALGELETPFFWTFVAEGIGFIDDWYYFEGPDLPGRSEMEALLAGLGISGELIGPEFGYGSFSMYYVRSDAATGLGVVEEINSLHQQLGDTVWFGFVGVGCPSGGGGGGPGTLGPLEIPTLGEVGLGVLAALLAAIALRSLRAPPYGRKGGPRWLG